MNSTVVRTTISLPVDLYEELRLEAFQRKTSVSHVVATKIKKTKPAKKLKPGESLTRLIGKYHVKNFREITREELYDDIIKHKMSAGF